MTATERFMQRLRANPGSIFAALASVISIHFVIATPFVASVVVTVSAPLTLAAAIVAWRKRIRLATTLLIPGAIAGLFPPIFPGFFALIALIILRKHPSYRGTS